MFIGTIKQTFILIFKKHQNILGANLKEEFLIRRSSLKVKPGERVKSIEDATCHEEREKRKVFAGTFGSGARTNNETKSFSCWIATVIPIFFVGIHVSALINIIITGYSRSPRVHKVLVVDVEIGSVGEDKGVGVFVGRLFWLLDGDPEVKFSTLAFIVILVDYLLSRLGVLTVRKKIFLTIYLLLKNFVFFLMCFKF